MSKCDEQLEALAAQPITSRPRGSPGELVAARGTPAAGGTVSLQLPCRQQTGQT